MQDESDKKNTTTFFLVTIYFDDSRCCFQTIFPGFLGWTYPFEFSEQNHLDWNSRTVLCTDLYFSGHHVNRFFSYKLLLGRCHRLQHKQSTD